MSKMEGENLICLSAVVHDFISIKQNMTFNFQLLSALMFLVFHKNGLNKSCSSFEDLSTNVISWSHMDWFKSCFHFRSLNVDILEWLELLC
jgi:hypothetical protein